MDEIVPVEVFRAEVLAWAKRLGVEPKEIRIRKMKRKWASCSSQGRLTFDQDLLRQPAPVRTLVILHELLHLRLPTHNKLFKSLLSAYFHEKYPDLPIPELPAAQDGGPKHGAPHKRPARVR
ncbi:MAG: M48 family metallopeptidase [Candidatus Bipolaricaulaceae bacterium]